MQQIEEDKYGKTCWDILEYLKYDDSILKIIAWQMKLENRPYDRESKCHGCGNAYLINSHLLECQKIKEKNKKILLEINKTI